MVVGAADDPAERRAARTAETVMRSIAPAAVTGGIRIAATTRIQPMNRGGAQIIRREMTGGDGWKVGGLASWTGGGLLTWSQSQLDAKLLELQEAHKALKSKLDNADSEIAKLSDAPQPKGLAEARLTYETWDKAVKFDDRDTASSAIKSATAAMDGVAKDLTLEHDKQVKELKKKVGGTFGQTLLATHSPKVVTALIGKVSLETLKSMGKGLNETQSSDVLSKLNSDHLMMTLGPLGGKWVLENFESMSLGALAANSTFDQLNDVTDRLDAKQLKKLAGAFDASAITNLLLVPLEDDKLVKKLADSTLSGEEIKTLLTDLGADVLKVLLKSATVTNIQSLLTDPGAPAVKTLGAEFVSKLIGSFAKIKNLIAALGVPQLKLLGPDLVKSISGDSANAIKSLVDDLGVERFKQMAAVKGSSRVAELEPRRGALKALLAQLGGNEQLVVDLWRDLAATDFDKIVANKPATEAASMIRDVGVTALKQLVSGMTQVQLYEHAGRLTKPAMKGLGEAMTGSDLLSVGVANPGDERLKALGTTHKQALADATAVFGNVATLNLVLGRCDAAGLTVPETAEFLADAAANGWKNAAHLTSFFNKVGANRATLRNRVTIAKLFAADGNDGTRPACPGEGGSAVAAASKNIGGKVYKAAEGDIDHFMAGHSYSHYEMSLVNAQRGTSTLWPSNTTRNTIIANAQAVLNHVDFSAYFNAGTTGWHPNRLIAGFRVGVNASISRITQMYPNGGTAYSIDQMEAVVFLFKSKA